MKKSLRFYFVSLLGNSLYSRNIRQMDFLVRWSMIHKVTSHRKSVKFLLPLRRAGFRFEDNDSGNQQAITYYINQDYAKCRSLHNAIHTRFSSSISFINRSDSETRIQSTTSSESIEERTF
mmetsp:Transcript_3041/g.8258  ORF Transcript_3041/g.8258 Transcript_3041/m.8258 type:complete len:121 (-) Transcript_3041:1993-2355(-)